MSSVKGTIATENLVIQNETRTVTSAQGNVTMSDANAVDTGLITMDAATAGINETQGIEPTDDLSANVAALELISLGTLDIDIDGAGATQITGMDFNGVSDVAGVKDVLVTALAALAVTVTESADKITFTSDSTGTSSSVEVVSGTGAGTSVVESGLIVMGTAVPGVAATQGIDPTVDLNANLTALELISTGAMNVNVDGAGAVEIIGLDFNGITTVEDVRAVIATGLSALNVTVTADATTITITSDLQTSSSSVAVTTGTGAGTDIVSAGLWPVGSAVGGVDITQGIDPTTDISANVAALAAISDGKLDITIDGVLTQAEGIDFTSDVTVADVANTLSVELVALAVTITESSDIITFKSDSSGASSTVEVVAGTGTGTNVVAGGLIVMGVSVDGVDAAGGYEPTTDISSNLVALELISLGTLDIDIDGVSTQITGIDFNGAADIPAIAVILATSLNALAVTVTEGSDIITIESDSSGATSTVEVTAGTGAGTNIVDTGLIVMGTSVDGEDATNGIDITTDISSNVTAIELVSGGTLDIDIDGAGAVEITGINLGGVASIAEVAVILAASLSALGVVVTETGDVITFTSDSFGSSSAIAITSGSGAGTNIVDTGLITMDTAVGGLASTYGKEVTDDLSGNIAALKALPVGALNIAIDGATAVEITGIDFSDIVTVADVAALLVTALVDLDVTVTESSDVITFTSGHLGVVSTIAITAATGDSDGTFIICDAIANSTVVALDMNGESRTLYALQGQRKDIMLTKIVSTSANIVIGK